MTKEKLFTKMNTFRKKLEEMPLKTDLFSIKSYLREYSNEDLVNGYYEHIVPLKLTDKTHAIQCFEFVTETEIDSLLTEEQVEELWNMFQTLRKEV